LKPYTELDNQEAKSQSLRVTRLGYQGYGNRCPRAADATSFKMAERECLEGYDIFSVFFGFVELI